MNFPTVSVVISGEGFAARVAEALVKQSMWFSVTPFPDDEWVISVKAGEGHRLDEQVAIEDGQL